MRPDPDAFAALLCDWCLEAREGDQVLVGTTVPSMPLALAVHGALLQRGAWPLLRLAADTLAESFYRHVRQRFSLPDGTAMDADDEDVPPTAE